MKFLHTSDWHVGRTIRNRSRQDEHRDVFAEIIDIARQEHVDAVFVTGDIFHERRPSLEAQELVATTLAELARAQIPSVVIPGNHADQVLSAAEGVGTSEDIRLSAYQSKVQDYFRALEDTIRRRDRQAVSVVLAHADILGCEFGGGEWRSNVFSLNAGILPAHVQYVALGHIHKPQAIPGARAQAHYAGSILQMDFGEREQGKSVCLIEAHPGKPAAVSQISLNKVKSLL